MRGRLPSRWPFSKLIVPCHRSLAAAALYDGGAELSIEKIKELVGATSNEVEPYWPMLMAKFLGDDKIKDRLLKPTC